MDESRQEEVVRRITMYGGGRPLLHDAAQVVCSMSYKSGPHHGVGKMEEVARVSLEWRAVHCHKMTRKIYHGFQLGFRMGVSGEFSGLGGSGWANKTTRQ